MNGNIACTTASTLQNVGIEQLIVMNSTNIVRKQIEIFLNSDIEPRNIFVGIDQHTAGKFGDE